MQTKTNNEEVDSWVAMFREHQTLFTTCHPNLFKSLQLSYQLAKAKEIERDLLALLNAGKTAYDAFNTPNYHLLTPTRFEVISVAECLKGQDAAYASYLETTLSNCIHKGLPFQSTFSDEVFAYALIVDYQHQELKGWLKRIHQLSGSEQIYLLINPQSAVYYMTD